MTGQRTLTEFLNGKKRVYLYIANKSVWKIFIKQASSEGFLWADGRKLKRVKYDNIVAVNNNMTFNYVGLIGHIWFNRQEDNNIFKIDFAKYINGADDYIYCNTAKTIFPTQKNLYADN